MKSALRKGYSLKRSIYDTLSFGQTQVASDRERHEEIRASFEKCGLATPAPSEHRDPKHQSFRGDSNRRNRGPGSYRMAGDPARL